MNKKILFWMIVLVMSNILLIAYNSEKVKSNTSGYNFNGDGVVWENIYGKIRVSPHTLTSDGCFEINATSYLATQNIDCALAINSSFEITDKNAFNWANYSHPEQRTFSKNKSMNYTCPTSNFTFNNSAKTFTCYNANGSLARAGYYESGILAQRIAFWNESVDESRHINNYYFDWQNINSIFSKQTLGNRDYYTISNVLFTRNVSRKAKFCIKIKPKNGWFKGNAKLDIFCKRSSETLSSALESGNIFIVDPWFSTNFLYRKPIQINNSANEILRKYHTLEVSGLDTTNTTAWNQSNPNAFAVTCNNTEVDKLIGNRTDLTSNATNSYYPASTGWATTNTTFLIRLKENISASTINNSMCYVYYGNLTFNSSFQNESEIALLYESFNRPNNSNGLGTTWTNAEAGWKLGTGGSGNNAYKASLTGIAFRNLDVGMIHDGETYEVWSGINVLGCQGGDDATCNGHYIKFDNAPANFTNLGPTGNYVYSTGFKFHRASTEGPDSFIAVLNGTDQIIKEDNPPPFATNTYYQLRTIAFDDITRGDFHSFINNTKRDYSTTNSTGKISDGGGNKSGIALVGRMPNGSEWNYIMIKRRMKNDAIDPTITMGAEERDNSSDPSDSTLPQINLTDPLNDSQYSTNTVTFSCNATDETALSNISLFTNFTGSWASNKTNSVSGTSNSTAFRVTGIAEGTYVWNCKATDTSNNQAYAPNNFTVYVDTILPVPTWINPSLANNSYTRVNFTFNYSVTETNLQSTFIDFNKSLVLWLRLNNASDENGTHVKDWSGYGFNGTLYNGANWTISGKMGSSVKFGGGNELINISDEPEFSPVNYNLTICSWLRPDTFDFVASDISGLDALHWLSKGQPNQHEWAFRMYNRTGENNTRPKRVSFYVFSLAGGLGTGSYFQDNLTEGEWIHVCGVSNGTHTIIYKNGILRNADAYGVTLGDGTAPVRIGRRTNTALNGSMDDVMIFSRALSHNEILSVYNGTRKQIAFNDTINANYTIRAYSQDLAGNVNSTEERTFTLDSVKPNILLSVPSESESRPEGNINLTYNISDANDISNCTLVFSTQANNTDNNVSVNTSEQSFAFNKQSGTYTWQVYCTDLANNVNASETRNLTLTVNQESGQGGGGGVSIIAKKENVTITNLTIEMPMEDKKTDYGYYQKMGILISSIILILTLIVYWGMRNFGKYKR